jgi:hypothetical protein
VHRQAESQGSLARSLALVARARTIVVSLFQTNLRLALGIPKLTKLDKVLRWTKFV